MVSLFGKIQEDFLNGFQACADFLGFRTIWGVPGAVKLRMKICCRVISSRAVIMPWALLACQHHGSYSCLALGYVSLQYIGLTMTFCDCDGYRPNQSPGGIVLVLYQIKRNHSSLYSINKQQLSLIFWQD